MLVANRPGKLWTGAMKVSLERLVQDESAADGDHEEQGYMPLANATAARLAFAGEEQEGQGQDEAGDENLDGSDEGEGEHEAGECRIRPAMDLRLDRQVKVVDAGVAEMGVQQTQQEEDESGCRSGDGKTCRDEAGARWDHVLMMPDEKGQSCGRRRFDGVVAGGCAGCVEGGDWRMLMG